MSNKQSHIIETLREGNRNLRNELNDAKARIAHLEEQVNRATMLAYSDRIAELTVRIAELTEQANAAYAPYRERVIEARAEVEKVTADLYRIENAIAPVELPEHLRGLSLATRIEEIVLRYLQLEDQLAAARAAAERLAKALNILMEFHPEDELGPATEDYWSPEYRAAIGYALRVLAEHQRGEG